IIERAVRDADGLRHLAQAERLMAALRDQARGGLQRRLLQIAMAIGRPARFCGHAPSYKGGPPNATASRLRAARHPVFAILRRDVLVDDFSDQFDDLTPRPELCGGMRGQIELAERER